MLAVQPRALPAFTAKALEYGQVAAEVFAATAMLRSEGPIPRPQRYQDLARKYGSVVWVYASVARKSVDVASVPLLVVRRTEAGVVDDVPLTHPLRGLLRRANPFMTGRQLVESITANLDLVGNAYCLKFRDNTDRPRELWPLRPDLVTIIGSPTDYIAGYQVKSGLQAFTFKPDQVVHFRSWNPFSDYYGLGALVPSWNPAVIEEEADVWNRNLLRNDARVAGILKSDKPLTRAQAEENAARWREMQAGPANAGRVAVLGAGLDFKAVALTPQELDYVQSRKLTREQILAAFGMRPVILGLESGDIGRRSEQLRDYFYATVGGRIAGIVDTLNEFLTGDFDEPGLEIHDDVETALLPYEDREALARSDALHIQNRVYTPNEVRARRGLPPLPGGDTVYVPTSLVPIAAAPGQGKPGAEGDPASGANPVILVPAGQEHLFTREPEMAAAP